jgi:hypothetical protein
MIDRAECALVMMVALLEMRGKDRKEHHEAQPKSLTSRTMSTCVTIFVTSHNILAF